MRYRKFFQRAAAGALAWLMLFQFTMEGAAQGMKVQAAELRTEVQQSAGEQLERAEQQAGQKGQETAQQTQAPIRRPASEAAPAASVSGGQPAASGYLKAAADRSVSAGLDAAGRQSLQGERIAIRLNAAGGTGVPAEKEVRCGLEYGTLPAPEREGYTFLGWYTAPEDGSGVRITETSIAGADSLTLYAHWRPVSFLVRLYGGAKAGAAEPSGSITATCGRTWGPLPRPEREGFAFDGWYTAYSGGRRIAENELVRPDDIRDASALYARWKGKTLTVSFDMNGGLGAPEPIRAETGREYGELPAAVREGCRFAGWYPAEGGSLPVTADTIVTAEADHTLRAAWEAAEISVSFDANGGKKITAVKSVKAGKRYGALPVPEYEGHIFLGWYLQERTLQDGVSDFLPAKADSAETETLITADTPVMQTDNHILRAHWAVNEYTVTLRSGMEGAADSSILVPYGGIYGKLPEPSRENYRFLGWYTKPAGGEEIENTDSVKLTSDQTLYGRWEGRACIVTFDRADGTGADSSKTVYYGRTYGTMPKPVRAGYVFDGWYLEDSDGRAKEITKNDTVRQTADHTLHAAWTVKMPRITLDAAGGSMICNGEAVESWEIRMEYGSRYGVLPTPERAGYTFAGWHESSAKDSPVTEDSTVTSASDKTIYAHWNGNVYPVLLDAAGGTLSGNRLSVTCGESYGELPVPEKENYDFSGWYTEPGGKGTKITKSSVVRLTGAQTLYAAYRGKPAVVTCDANGGTVSSASRIVYYGEPYGALPTPSRGGYIFDGWYTGPAGGERITAESTVLLTGDAALYAHWSMVTYKISFDANGGIASSDSKQVVYGEAYGALPLASREGYTFLGWYTTKTGSTKLSETDIVKTAADKTYYAKWQANKYTVTFAMNGGTASTHSKQVTFGSSYSTLPTPKRTGYTFAGWYTKDTYGTRRLSTSKVEIAGDHTLYAKWKSEIFVVTFLANGGTVAIKDIAVPAGTSFSAFPAPEREGYDFIGWYTTAATSSGVLVTSLREMDTLYARWQPKKYTVTFDPQGGTPLIQRSAAYGEDYGTLPAPSKAGFTFSGWYTAPVGGTKITATTAVKTAGAHTLYARWKSVSSTLSYDANGGSAVTTTKTVTSGEKYGVLSEPARTGYTFDGWYTAPAGGQRVTPDTIVTAAADHTLYAHWTIQRPAVKFAANGGRVYENGLKTSSTTVNYTWGQKYGSFPKAERTGYTFEGWYTSSTGSTRITEDMICEAADTLYAHWKGIPQKVSFDTNTGYFSMGEITGGRAAGGTADASRGPSGVQITVVYGQEYGTLPTVVYDGYTFDTDIIGLNQKTFCLRVLPIKSYFFTLFTHSPLIQGRIFTQKPRKENSEWQKS